MCAVQQIHIKTVQPVQSLKWCCLCNVYRVASLTSCANLCHFLCSVGATFKAQDLSSLQIGDMKTKMLLGALTKLGKLRVQVDNGQIIGYRMDL